MSKERGPDQNLELVKFEEAECCALRYAFASNPKTAALLVKAIGEEKVRLSAEILNRTSRLGFPHNPEVDEIYYEIAQAELSRIEKGEVHFDCGHSTEEHKEALLSVISMTTPKSVN